MAQLEANSTQIAPELESEGGEDHLHGNRNQGSGEPNSNARIKHAQMLAAKTSRDKFELDKALTKKTCDRNQLKEPNKHERRLKFCLATMREKMNILQLFLLHFGNRAHQGNPMKPFLPREEIAKHKMNFRMVHETNSLAEEKKLLKEINARQKEVVDSVSPLGKNRYFPPSIDTRHLRLDEYFMVINPRNVVENCLRQIQELKWRSARSGIIFQSQWDGEAIADHASYDANAAAYSIANAKGKIWDSLSSKKALQEQIRVTAKEMDELTKSLAALRRGQNIKRAGRKLKVVERDIECLKKKMTLMDQKKDEAYECVF
ncbi:hypothetical protein ACFX16_043150 [Malus domestica]